MVCGGCAKIAIRNSTVVIMKATRFLLNVMGRCFNEKAIQKGKWQTWPHGLQRTTFMAPVHESVYKTSINSAGLYGNGARESQGQGQDHEADHAKNV